MGMTAIKTGDTVTIRRGKLKGETATVETIAGHQVVVKLADGTLDLQNETNLLAPEEATIGARALADAFSDVASSYGEVEAKALRELADRLTEDMPSFSAKSVSWPSWVQNAD
jgi:hypothetical protein